MRKLKGFVALTLVMSLMAAKVLPKATEKVQERKESATAADSNPLKGKKLVMAINAEYAPFESKVKDGTH